MREFYSGFYFTLSSAAGDFAPTLSRSPAELYDVISISQDVGNGVAKLLPVSDLVISPLKTVDMYLQTKCPLDIDLTLRLLYYFRFLKTTGIQAET